MQDAADNGTALPANAGRCLAVHSIDKDTQEAVRVVSKYNVPDCWVPARCLRPMFVNLLPAMTWNYFADGYTRSGTLARPRRPAPTSSELKFDASNKHDGSLALAVTF